MASARTLLLIEDDDTTREVLTLLLELDGWAVQAVPSGEAALALPHGQANSPGVVLCDQKLPGICGTALADALRETYGRAGHPVPVLLAMSATLHAEPPEGYATLLRKPISPAEVSGALQALREAATVQTPRAKAEPAETANAEPILDRTIFDQLVRGMGAKGTQDLYRFALADASDRVTRITTARSTGRTEIMVREAHALKGSCGMIGARRLPALAAALEAGTEDPRITSGTEAGNSEALTAALDEIRLMLETLFPLHL